MVWRNILVLHIYVANPHNGTYLPNVYWCEMRATHYLRRAENACVMHSTLMLVSAEHDKNIPFWYGVILNVTLEDGTTLV